MNFNGWKEKIKFNSNSDFDEQEEFVEDAYEDGEDPNYGVADNGGFRAAMPSSYASAPTNTVPAASHIMIFEPKVYADGDAIINKVRAGHHVIVNFEATDHGEAHRLMDFLSGGAFAINASIEQVGVNIMLCVPSTAKVTRNPVDTTPYSNLTDTLSWKEPVE